MRLLAVDSWFESWARKCDESNWSCTCLISSIIILAIAAHVATAVTKKTSNAIFGDHLVHNLFRYPLTWLHNKASEVIMADKATMEHMMFLSTEAKCKKYIDEEQNLLTAAIQVLKDLRRIARWTSFNLVEYEGAINGLETVNQMPWTEMKQLMTAEFCPIEEVQRMEHELWNLKVKEYDVVAYTQRFNELALMCPRMVEPERMKVDAYIQGLTDNIKGEVNSSKPADLNEAVHMAHKLMEQKSQARDERILEGKKQKWESFQSGNSSGKGNQKDNSRQTLQNSQNVQSSATMVKGWGNGQGYCKEKSVLPEC
ncbi:putative reverse transcriptase domain-containing protein [Tanacetum coccineum]